MANIPEHTVTNNPHGAIIFGPVGTENDGSVLNVATTKGHHDHYNSNGNKTSITPKKSEEICGGEFVEGRKDDENGNASKVIICKNGDMIINCEQGRFWKTHFSILFFWSKVYYLHLVILFIHQTISKFIHRHCFQTICLYKFFIFNKLI